MLSQDLVLLDIDCASSDEVIRTLAQKFVEAGVVKESFVNAVAEREKVYPTALPATAFPIAIPHTVSEHVITPAIGVGILRHPVEFSQMGSPEIKLQPEMVIMLAIKDPKEQLGLLRKMMKLIQNEGLLKAVKASGSKEEVCTLFNDALK